MITQQIMIRDLNGVSVRQNHKTGFFNANDLLNLYNKNNTPRILSDYLATKSYAEYKEVVCKDIILNTGKTLYLKDDGSDTENVSVDSLVLETKRGKYGGTWMHPYIFMDFAMWLSPEFKLTCIKWIYDKLIEFRDEAGDTYKKLASALFDRYAHRAQTMISDEAIMLNTLTFGKHENGMRNTATEKELLLLNALQDYDIELIQKGAGYSERLEKLQQAKQIFKFSIK